MSFIGGYFCRGGRLSDEDIRKKLERFSILPGDDPGSYETVVESFKFGHIIAKFKPDGPTQIRRTGNDAFSILTLGFHDLCYDELVECRIPESEWSSRASCGRAEMLKRSEGEFVSVLLERELESLHIVNDRFSTRPLYWFQHGELTAFSSNLLFLMKLANFSCRPDPLGWLQIFSYGHTLGERTNIENIKRLRPGSHTLFSEKHHCFWEYWRLRHDVDYGLDCVEHSERTFEAMCRSAAMRSGLVDHGFVSLSGGLDSRLVAGAIPKEADFFTMTIADSLSSNETPEVQVAGEVSKLLNREHHVKTVSMEEISSIAESLVMLTGGLTPIHHPAKTYQAIREMICESGFKLGGGPGDSLAGAFAGASIQNIYPVMTERQVYKFIVWRRKFSQALLGDIFNKEVTDEYFGKLDESMKECFSILSGPTCAHRTTAWAMSFRQPAFTFTSPIHNHPDVTEASPHLGYDYADCMLKLPADWIYQKNFYKFMIYHCLPDLRDVIYANTGKNLPGRMAEYNVSVRKKITSGIERFLPAGPLEDFRKRRLKPRGGTTFEYDMLRADKKLFGDVCEILHSFSGLNELLNIKGCHEFIRDYEEGRIRSGSAASDAELMGSLASLCYWYKLTSL